MAAPLTVKPRVEDDIGILELSGTLTLGPSLVGLRNNARQLLDGNRLRGLIVQVGAVKQTDSSGLGELTVVYTLATAKRCPVRLVAANNDMRKILVVTRLDRVLPVSDDLETAKDEIRKSATKQASSPG